MDTIIGAIVEFFITIFMELFLEIFFKKVLFYLGYFTIKVFTLYKYPKNIKNAKDEVASYVVGILVFILILILSFKIFAK